MTYILTPEKYRILELGKHSVCLCINDHIIIRGRLRVPRVSLYSSEKWKVTGDKRCGTPSLWPIFQLEECYRYLFSVLFFIVKLSCTAKNNAII